MARTADCSAVKIFPASIIEGKYLFRCVPARPNQNATVGRIRNPTIPEEVHRVNIEGDSVLQPIDERVYDRHEYRAVDLRRNMHQRPHMVVEVDGTRFTSVMAFLEKTSAPL